MESNENKPITMEMVQPLLDKMSPLCAGLNLGIVIHASLCVLATAIAQCEENERQKMIDHVELELPNMIEFTLESMEEKE